MAGMGPMGLIGLMGSEGGAKTETKFHHRDTEDTEVRPQEGTDFLRSVYSSHQELDNLWPLLTLCSLCLCGECLSLYRSVLGSFAGGAHFYEFRVEPAEYFNQVGLSSHHPVDIFVNTRDLIQPSTQ